MGRCGYGIWAIARGGRWHLSREVVTPTMPSGHGATKCRCEFRTKRNDELERIAQSLRYNALFDDFRTKELDVC
jgi:hypothetical protein